jgi:hypothetical protein
METVVMMHVLGLQISEEVVVVQQAPSQVGTVAAFAMAMICSALNH